jgi:hypothetical protein
MYDREHELYDVFGYNPTIQPLMRKTSKMAYEKSKLSLHDVQCQQPISKTEISNFIQNNNYGDIAIFYPYSVYTVYSTYDALKAYMLTNGGGYMATVGDNSYRGKDVTGVYAEVKEAKPLNYHEFVELLSEDSRNQFVEQGAIFVDPFTTYKILSERQICFDLNKNYSKIQTLKQFDGLVDRYSDFTKIPFLNVYLIASATVMGIEDGGLQEFGTDIKVSLELQGKKKGYALYKKALEKYSEETKNGRLNLIQKIRNEITNLH